MLPDRVSNPGPLTYESGALPIALRGPAYLTCTTIARVDLAHYGVSRAKDWFFEWLFWGLTAL